MWKWLQVWKLDSCSGGEEAECISYNKRAVYWLVGISSVPFLSTWGQVGGYDEPKAYSISSIYLFIHSFIPFFILEFFTPLCLLLSSFFCNILFCYFLLSSFVCSYCFPSFLYFLLCGSNSFSCMLFLGLLFKGFFLVPLLPCFLHLSFGSFHISFFLCLVRLISFFTSLLCNFFGSVFRS